MEECVMREVMRGIALSFDPEAEDVDISAQVPTLDTAGTPACLKVYEIFVQHLKIRR